ncbi:hypothetical protein GCM10018962_54440 [Dactylosporangium matsuzakiense]
MIQSASGQSPGIGSFVGVSTTDPSTTDRYGIGGTAPPISHQTHATPTLSSIPATPATLVSRPE